MTGNITETMMDYIKESPELCRSNILNSKMLTVSVVDKYLEKDFKRILIIASGSSYNGAGLAKYLMEKVLNVKVDIVTSFTYQYYENQYDKDTFVIGIGQSGRSMNTNDALQLARKRGLTAVGLTGNVDSVMKDCVDTISNWGMGIEKIGFVTKGVTTLGLYLMLFAIEAGSRNKAITVTEKENYMNQLLESCDKMTEMINISEQWYHDNENELTDLKRVQITGYGPNLAVAQEGALKIAETTGHAATAYEQEEYLHGPSIETNGERTVIVVDSLGQPSERAIKLYESSHYLTNRVFLITNKIINDKRVCTLEHNISEYVSPLVNVIPFQVISAYGRDKWVNPMDDQRKLMNDVMGSKSPKTGKELGI